MKLLYHNMNIEEPAGRADTTGAPRDLLLLVLALPEAQGLQLWNEVLGDESLRRLPIAVLLAHGHEAARALGIKNGAANSLKRPSLANVKRLLRREEPGCNPDRLIETGELVIDPATYRVSRPGKTVRLTPLEFRLLYFLAGHPNRFFTREQLLSTLWEHGHDLNERIVDVYMRRVRLKVEAEPENPVHLKTVRGLGYVFDPAVAAK
jgi:two-component system, OmpR family, alkaline phosphatase synthesis response regulator PhoP